jgi:ribonuclease-3
MPDALKNLPLTSKARVAELSSRLQLVVPDEALVLAAMTHKSYCNEHKSDPCTDNERLEFLGDAVVDLAIGHRLMERFPAAHEGELSKLRALIVNEEGLAKVARSIRLGELLLLGRGEELSGGQDKPSLLADALEAVIGAVYLSQGMSAALGLIDRLFADALGGVADGRQGMDYKSILQEEAQRRLKAVPKYRIIAETGPQHDKTFEVEVTLAADVTARSSGRSKKEAEQAAAKSALALLQNPGDLIF